MDLSLFICLIFNSVTFFEEKQQLIFGNLKVNTEAKASKVKALTA